MKGATVLRIGIFGVGSIGQTIATALDAGRIDAQLVAIADLDKQKAEAFAAKLASRPRVVSLHELIQRTDLTVEAAGQEALREFVPKALAAGRDMLIMSVGGLLGHDEWFRQAAEKDCRIYVPSGAIAGLDGIKSGSIGYVQCAMLTSRKPIAALRGTKYVVEHNVPLDNLTEETVIFEGTAEEAARAFPHHIERGCVSPAGRGADRAGAGASGRRARRKQERSRNSHAGRIWEAVGGRRKRAVQGESAHLAAGCFFGPRNLDKPYPRPARRNLARLVRSANRLLPHQGSASLKQSVRWKNLLFEL